MQHSVRIRVRYAAVLALAWAGIALADTPGQPEKAPPDLTELSLSELTTIQVTLVGKKAEDRFHTPAAVSVITGDDIRRSGITSVVEALRLAPGVQVSRINGDQWAVGMRGFASRLSRSMLALMSGRSVYTPLFAGVYWEVQDTLLEDVDRIEVVRGPGGTLWGANAVNGVVNVITKSAKETHGLFVDVGAGNLERGFGGIRYGGSLGKNADYRVYAKYFDRAPAFHSDGAEFDSWHMAQGGFRLDWERSQKDGVTFQGDLYDGRLGQRSVITTYAPPFSRTVEDPVRASGGNLLGRWQRSFSKESALTAQVYYDRTDRSEPTFSESRDTLDVDVQYNLSSYGRHDFVGGVGYRLSGGRTTGVPTLVFEPPDRTDELFSVFAQDQVSLAAGRLVLTLGAKLEHNDYSGFEVQPSGRFLWLLGPRHSAWLAASRAVRTPTRVETDMTLTSLVDPRGPLYVRSVPNPEFRPEVTRAYEAGYRVQVREWLAVDVAAFINRATDLLGGRLGGAFVELQAPPPRLVIPVLFENLLEADAQGAELAVEVHPLGRWRLAGAYSYLDLKVRQATSAPGQTPDSAEGSSPEHQLWLRSSLDLPGKVSLDAFFRYVGELPTQSVPSYGTLDLRLAWTHGPLEISAVGQNLLDPRHPEFAGTSGIELRRGAYARATLRW